MDVNEGSFEADVVDRSHERPVVVDFWADWCGPCKALAPVLEREVAAREGQIELAKVDVDANQGLAREYSVRGIPAVKAFRNGRVVGEFVGAQSPQSVAAFLDGLLAPNPGERLLAELRETGDAPDVLAALEAGDSETALALLLDEVKSAAGERRELLRARMVALFVEIGQDDPLVVRFRRALASILF